MSASLLSSSRVLMRRGLTCTATSTSSRPTAQQPMPAATKNLSTNAYDLANSFTYRLSAAASPKRAPVRVPTYGQDYWNLASTHYNPHPPYLTSTKRDAGEDAFFVSTIGGSKHHVAFGVADGVGGWAESGVDPSIYSQALCGLMAGTSYIHEGVESGNTFKPRELLQTAYDAVMQNPRIEAGGCTASLAVADVDGRMVTANLGDSGFLVLSPGKVVHRSTSQTHAFNTPYQFSKMTPRMQRQQYIFGGTAHFSETPADADETLYDLKHGDIVLFATDGVWDNLSAQDTLAIATKVMQDHGYWSKPQDSSSTETIQDDHRIRAIPSIVDEGNAQSYLPGLLSRAVMREAKITGLDRKRNGPFAKEVRQRYPSEGWVGGKPDDIAVVVCIAVRGEAEQPTDGSKGIKAKL